MEYKLNNKHKPRARDCMYERVRYTYDKYLTIETVPQINKCSINIYIISTMICE